MNETALMIRSPSELIAIGELFESSGMFGCTQKGQGLVLAMTCVMKNMTPIEVNQTYHIIEGRLSMRADAMLARFVERGGRYKIVERSEKRAAAIFVKDDNRLEAEYTMEEARRSGICLGRDGKLKANWQRFPKQMLWARLVSDSVRALDPGVCAGTYTPEEVADIEYEPAGAPIFATPPEAVQKTDHNQPQPQPQTDTDRDRSTTSPASGGAQNPTSEPAAVAPQQQADQNYGVMPVGRLAGTPWTEFTTEQLLKVLSVTHAAITEKHKEAVQAELERRAK